MHPRADAELGHGVAAHPAAPCGGATTPCGSGSGTTRALELKAQAAAALGADDALLAARLLTAALQACAAHSDSTAGNTTGSADSSTCIRDSAAGATPDVSNAVDALQRLRAVLYCNRSACHAADGAWAQALVDARVAARLEPSWHKPYVRQALAHSELGHFSDAAHVLDDGIVAVAAAQRQQQQQAHQAQQQAQHAQQQAQQQQGRQQAPQAHAAPGSSSGGSNGGVGCWDDALAALRGARETVVAAAHAAAAARAYSAKRRRVQASPSGEGGNVPASSLDAAQEALALLRRAGVAQCDVPVTVVSGFLGAGKTTLMRHLLSTLELSKVGVLVNDLAAVNVDARLLAGDLLLDAMHHDHRPEAAQQQQAQQQAQQQQQHHHHHPQAQAQQQAQQQQAQQQQQQQQPQLLELSNGCICCNLRGDLLLAVARLLSEHPHLTTLLVEATGVGEPRPVAETLAVLNGYVRVDTLVTVVDAPQFADLMGLGAPQERTLAPVASMGQRAAGQGMGRPGSGMAPAGVVTVQPDESASAPGVQTVELTLRPGEGTLAPVTSIGQRAAGQGMGQPGAGMGQPGAGMGQPGAGMAPAGVVTVLPGALASAPGAVQPEELPLRPAGRTLARVASIGHRAAGQGMGQPGASAVAPGVGMARPAEARVQPGESALAPGMQAVQPEADGEVQPLASLLAEQVEYANVVILNKCDLVSQHTGGASGQRDLLACVRAAVRALAPGALVLEAVRCAVEPSQVLGTHRFDSEAIKEAAGEWLAPRIPRSAWPVSRPGWTPRWGDRRQALVFIGRGLDADALRARLESCLVTEPELSACVGGGALPGVFDVLSDREEAQHQALWPAFLAAKVARKRAQFHRARLVVDGERGALDPELESMAFKLKKEEVDTQLLPLKASAISAVSLLGAAKDDADLRQRYEGLVAQLNTWLESSPGDAQAMAAEFVQDVEAPTTA
ncbi:hypothetical protein FOA52_007342 [Chlamydomonas sp. UWO 241]|nr:hypothetical protein FOA52_007342 [Chlamydomonas sp. UWO 241]